MAPILMYHVLKATTPFVDASVNKRLRQFLPSINDCLLQFSDRREVSNICNYCVQHTILQKFTNFHAIRSWSFQNICNETRWPHFLGHPVYRN